MSSDIQASAGHAHHIIEIRVNSKLVKVPKEVLTGFEIKEAAIAQGVSIEPNFVLQEELGDGHTRVIGDGDTVKVRNEQRFTAIAPDDNS
jgi:hypothetical protein